VQDGRCATLPRVDTLADAGQESLAKTVKPLAAEDLIGLVASFAKAMAGMHDRVCCIVTSARQTL
jgi:hypothetical protein